MAHRSGVLGRDISYSLSPKIHKLFAEEAGIDLNYEIYDVEDNPIPFIYNFFKSSSFFLISFPDLWLTSPLYVMTWHISDDVAKIWTSTALRANRYSCTLVWAEWVRAHEGWRKDGFGRELDPQSCTTGKSIPVCGLTQLAGEFS